MKVKRFPLPSANLLAKSFWILPLVIFLPALGFLRPQAAIACPFCNAVSQTIRQEMAAMDAVVIGEIIAEPSEREAETGLVRLKAIAVLKGDTHISVGDKIVTTYYGKIEKGRRFMLSGVDPPTLLWSCVPLTETAEAYVRRIPELGEDSLTRLRFFYDYLQSDESMLRRDAYDEFAIAPYDVIKKLNQVIDHDQLVGWLSEPELPADRKRLFLTLLGVVGNKGDLPLLEKMLRSTQKSSRGGLDALIACYLTLAGSDGLPLIDELFLTKKQTPYSETHAAVMALRFHGTEGGVIPRSALIKSMHHVLDSPDMADIVIPDLARWKDWSQIERLKKLFINADPDDNWSRIPIVNYLRACPLPEAKAALEELEKIDPESISRANTYYTVPIPARDVPALDSRANPPQSNQTLEVPEAPGKKALRFDSYAEKSPPTESSPLDKMNSRRSVSTADEVGLNPFRLLGVIGMSALSFSIATFCVLTGGGPPPDAT